MTCDNQNSIVSQLPGYIQIEMIQGNDLVFTIDWAKDLTDYTFLSEIIPNTTSIPNIPITVTPINIAAGTMSLIITKLSIAALPLGTHKWYFNWTTPIALGSLTRTLLTGDFILSEK